MQNIIYKCVINAMKDLYIKLHLLKELNQQVNVLNKVNVKLKMQLYTNKIILHNNVFQDKIVRNLKIIN